MCVLLDMCAGAAAGLLSDFLLHPLDTITTRLWIQGSPGTTYRYSGLFHGIRQVIRLEGVKGLYKGFFAVAVLSPFGHGLYFASYHWCKASLSVQVDYPAIEIAIHALSGVLANAVGGLVWTPMDIVKLHQQASVRTGFLTPFHGLLDLYRKGGWFFFSYITFS
jgi:hypothetical protein